MDAESIALQEGQPRVKFQPMRIGSLNDFFSHHSESVLGRYNATCDVMKKHMAELEELGVTPVLFDGKVGGNGGAILPTDAGEFFILTKSGKQAKLNMNNLRDFTIVKSFNRDNWSCEYYANDEDTIPTSDAPLYFTTLHAYKKLGWTSRPMYMLHGHAFATEKEAERFGFPISTTESQCSTPEDSELLFELLKIYPFPEHTIFIRKGHGFVLIGANPEDAYETFQKKMKPFL